MPKAPNDMCHMMCVAPVTSDSKPGKESAGAGENTLVQILPRFVNCASAPFGIDFAMYARSFECMPSTLHAPAACMHCKYVY